MRRYFYMPPVEPMDRKKGREIDEDNQRRDL